MVDEITDAIETNAQGPQKASADGVSAEQHSLPDQIAADKYLAAKRATAANPAKGFVKMRIVPPGAV